MEFNSINPYNGQHLGQYAAHSEDQTVELLNRSRVAFNQWKKSKLKERSLLMARAGRVLREGIAEYARMITLEMGKPITESRAEIQKCAWVCEYYADNSNRFLADEAIITDAQKSFVRHDPIGTILAIMPWNFPFWQVFRFAAPTLTAGNTAVLKHAPNVFGCAGQIESVFRKAGFPPDVFQNLIIHHDKIEPVIAHDAVKAITLTGSERAGAAVAACAGQYIKKTVLELGGSNSFIVWPDADLDAAVSTAVTARMLNGGQSCIAAKRFILVEDIYEEFVAGFSEAVNQLKSGDPMDESTQVGPLARRDLADQLQSQVQRSVAHGAELLQGGHQQGCYHEPTILGNVKPGMPAFDEETFGPLAAMIKVKDEAEAFELSELSKYGLGTTVFTINTGRAEAQSGYVSDGAYFINEMVKSDPRLPFGGEKNSGYGRELARDGMMEFVNRKTIYLK